MKPSSIFSAQVTGFHVDIVVVEVDIARGLHAFSIIGLADKAVGEARDRVSSAIKNSGFVSPKQKNQKVVISLAPGSIKKEGTGFDLAIAVAYLNASMDIGREESKVMYIGELSLDGTVRPVAGVLPMILAGQKVGINKIFIPEGNTNEASLVKGMAIHPVRSLRDLILHLDNTEKIPPINKSGDVDDVDAEISTQYDVDFYMVEGRQSVKRALTIAAIGRHNVMLCGPPGVGKTMLARAFRSIMPRLSYGECVEVTSIHSAAGILSENLITHPPFRSPHHTSTKIAVIGGGSSASPGEITLAHRGILFLDEFSEFSRDTIEALRQPMEDRVVTVSRARDKYTLPADAIIITTMNPCPCGMLGSFRCSCGVRDISRYRKKVSGPIADRIDIWINFPQEEPANDKNHEKENLSSKEIKSVVERARLFIGRPDRNKLPSPSMTQYLKIISAREQLSMRGATRVMKVARTIADMSCCSEIKKEHLDEALLLRMGSAHRGSQSGCEVRSSFR